jgi:hypothetical protein
MKTTVKDIANKFEDKAYIVSLVLYGDKVHQIKYTNKARLLKEWGDVEVNGFYENKDSVIIMIK